ncbi:unnamed protein product [Euphydryas editha]|uniref:Uncharacterized protein n=1 Tax=Euphydryas editha TaxID=104508 RepID=A0AAU9UQW1_EUPED|nr:unnamed protein product [Euphydryas editha]
MSRSVRLERTTTVTTTLLASGGCKHSGRSLAKLLLERSVLTESADLYLTADSTLKSPERYLTPDATLAAAPDVIPRHAQRSPSSEEFATPECTGADEHSFAMPTYFDRKRKAASIVASAVQPLANFQMFKQKSLNTIPALIEKSKRTEELFTNFPFLTPLANRKNSLVSNSNRLSGCLEDEFYCIPALEVDSDSLEHVDVRHRFRSLSNQALGEALTSTPKADERRSYDERARNPSSGSLTASASESGSLERARAHERRAPPADDQHAASCRVENTRVNPDSLIDELLAATDLKHAVDDAAETSGLQLYITRDGTAELGSRRRQQLARRDYQRVVLHPHDNSSAHMYRSRRCAIDCAGSIVSRVHVHACYPSTERGSRRRPAARPNVPGSSAARVAASSAVR